MRSRQRIHFAQKASYIEWMLQFMRWDLVLTDDYNVYEQTIVDVATVSVNVAVTSK
jgi:hypothetical protein